MFSKILVPLDGSDESEEALIPAAAIAEKFGAGIVLLEVSPGFGRTVGAAIAEAFGALGSVQREIIAEQVREEAATAYLDAVREACGHPEWSSVQADGEPAEVIVEQARKLGCDLIVMATRERSRLKRQILGSVAEEVIRTSGVPVLVVHTGKGSD
ncbi:MAG: universal stress protein [Dehalococcoidia bacterium]